MTKIEQIEINSDELEQLRAQVTAFCTKGGYRLSPQADAILRDMVHIKQLTGDYYCPCQPRKTPETVCICQPVRNGLVDILGSCFCNLILRPETITIKE